MRPAEARQHFHSWGRAFFSTGATRTDAAAAQLEMGGYLGKLLMERAEAVARSLAAEAPDAVVFHAGTTLDNEGAMVTNKASAMQTVDGGGMLTVKGGLVKIN